MENEGVLQGRIIWTPEKETTLKILYTYSILIYTVLNYGTVKWGCSGGKTHRSFYK